MSKIVKVIVLVLVLCGVVALSPVEEASASGGPNCCQNLFTHCVQVICRDKGGVAEFNCNAETCQASCLCNVFP